MVAEARRRISVPVPEPGKNYLVIKMDAELVDKAGSLDGRFEDDLTAAIEETIRDFIRTRPLSLMFPRAGP